MNMSHKNQLVLYSATMALIVILAYARLIPAKLQDIPHYDSIGHFILYGLWGYLFGKVFHKSVLSTNFRLPQGIIVATAIAIVEETLQQLSPIRNFSLYDLGFGLLGILMSCLILDRQSRKRKV